jgi:glycosyltransferase involved in cell wall biosynthesis
LSRVDLRTVPRAARRVGRELARRVQTEADRVGSRNDRADLALFHELEAPPAGGGHQFLRALLVELRGRGLDVESNRISGRTGACLFNSFNFDAARLRRFAREDCRLVHRVDGPIGAYRGFDDGTDRRIAAINQQVADATIFQSRFSLEKHGELGYELRDPVVIPNAVDPAIFHPPGEREPLDGRRARVVASSWSVNPRKGAETFSWLDRHLERERYEVTYLGHAPAPFDWIRAIGPLPSDAVAAELRRSDVYVAASRDDPCSNALLEALACGLPAAYLDSGGHPELVGRGGLPFRTDDELPEVLDLLVEGLDGFRAAIATATLASVADRYLEVLGLAPPGRA